MGVANSAPVRVIRDDGQGLSRARNAAIKAARGELVAFIDDDCEADPRWLEVLSDKLAETPEAGVIGGLFVAPPKARRGFGACPHWSVIDGLYRPTGAEHHLPEQAQVLGGNLAIRRSVAEQIGFFDEFLGAGGLFPSAEDWDFVFRTVRAGFAVRTTPEAVVNHTFGWRYGVHAVRRLQQNYLRALGAYNAKMTLAGLSSGAEALSYFRREIWVGWMRERSPVTPVGSALRFRAFADGYGECLARFELDHQMLLRPRESAIAAS